MHTERSAKGLIRMCCCSCTVYPALDSLAIKGKYDQRMLLSECADGRLTRVFARRTRRFVKPRDCRRYIRISEGSYQTTDVQAQSVQADPSLRTSFIVGFATHRPMHDLFVQTIMPNTLGKIFNRRHFEIFFSFFQENRICILCKLSPLHECQTLFSW